jgi:hypothetical protein
MNNKQKLAADLQESVEFQGALINASIKYLDKQHKSDANIERLNIFTNGFKMAWDHLKRIESLAELSRQAQDNGEYD